MKTLFLGLLLPLYLLPTAAYTAPNKPNPTNHRRAFLQSLTGIAAASTLLPTASIAASSSSKRQSHDVYFGAGCFWHVQHEFVSAERSLLSRRDSELTSLAGYAGGTEADADNRVCYHNFRGVADYGTLGHGEVVGMSIPEERVGDFSVEYFKLFGDRGERADPMDKGGEYRSLLGLPGGTRHPQYSLVEAAAEASGMTLKEGKGNDPDTLGKRIVYVMDSNKFPFYQAEVYHQYHNDFLSPAYGKEYNNLADAAVDDGRIQITGCPDRMSTIVKNQIRTNSNLAFRFPISGLVIAMISCVLIWKARRKFYDSYSSIDQGDKDSDIVGDDVETEMEVASFEQCNN